MRMIISSVIVAWTTCAFAMTEKVDGVKWTYHVKDCSAILGDYEVVTRLSGVIGTNYCCAINRDTEGKIIIPNTLGGYKVVEVGYGAFASCTGITEVVFGNYITNIAESAFAGCSKLSKVSFNEGLQSIQAKAFGGCSSLTEITFPETISFLDWSAFNTVRYKTKDGEMRDGCGLHVVFFKGDCPQVQGSILQGPWWNDSQNASRSFPVVLFVSGRHGWGVPGSVWCGGDLMHGTAIVDQMIGQNIVSGRQIVSPGDVVTLTCTNVVTYVSWNGNKKSVLPIKIYYTVDGSAPTKNSSLYTKGIPIEHATTIAASIVGADFGYSSALGGYPRPAYPSWYATVSSSNVVHATSANYSYPDSYELYCDLNYNVFQVCSYAFGETQTPAIDSTNGKIFNWPGNTVSLSCETEDAEIHYTLDGSEPTEESALYTEPFTIDDTTTVRAKAFKTDWFESETVTETFTRQWYTVETPVIEPSEAEFANASQEVSISCGTEDATIWYTLDGSAPGIGDGLKYEAPFTIYRTCTVKAVAVKDDWKRSAVAEKSFVRAEGLSGAANMYGQTMETDGSHPWTVDYNVSRDGISSVRSGSIDKNGMTGIQASVKKAGTVSFWWRARCEAPDEEEGEDGYYDYGVFLVDDVAVARIAGNDTGWVRVEHSIATGGKHILRWEYRKDNATTYAPDCIWLDCVQWLPVGGAEYTTTTPTAVPFSWLDQYGLGFETDYETAAMIGRGKGCVGGTPWCAWQDYVAGTDPTNTASAFITRIDMTDGVPRISWEPDLNTNGEIRVYKVWGKESLSDPDWEWPTNSLHRFFKVSVEMP